MNQFSILCFKDIQMRLTLVKPASNQMTLILNKYFYYLGFEAVSSESVHYSVSTQQLAINLAFNQVHLDQHGWDKLLVGILHRDQGVPLGEHLDGDPG